MPIPKIIHQTWKTTDVPDKWKKSPEMWKIHHPDWEYKLWTDEDNRSYIQTHYPDLLWLYDSYPYGIQRADFIRYFILKDFGGVYSDLDLYPVENIEKYIDMEGEDGVPPECYLVRTSGYPHGFTNSFMISQKGASFWDDVILALQKPLPWWVIGKHLTVEKSTGPYMINQVVNEHKKVVGLLPYTRFMAYSLDDDYSIVKEGAVLMPLEGQSWNGWDSYFYNFVGKHRVKICGGFVLLFLLCVVALVYVLWKYVFFVDSI